MVSTAYDTDADALYVKIGQGEIARTRQLDDWTMVDEDAHGAALGLEVIHPARDWPLTEFLTRYSIDPATAGMLRALFPGAEAARPTPFEAASVGRDTTTVELVTA